MKIMESKKTVRFGDLKEGEVFSYGRFNNSFIKIQKIEVTDKGDFINAVSLEHGMVLDIEENDEVIHYPNAVLLIDELTCKGEMKNADC